MKEYGISHTVDRETKLDNVLKEIMLDEARNIIGTGKNIIYLQNHRYAEYRKFAWYTNDEILNGELDKSKFTEDTGRVFIAEDIT